MPYNPDELRNKDDTKGNSIQSPFTQNILAIDLEILPGENIFHIGAVFNGKRFERKNITAVNTALMELSDFSQGAGHLLGHNIATHDLPAITAICPEASFLRLPVIDTLFLSPLAFPENPYHKLIKDYKPLKTSKNDPVADARLALAVFDDQLAAFRAFRQTEPRLPAFYAFALEPEKTSEERFGLAGNFNVFQNLSGQPPKSCEAKIIFKDLSRGKVCDTGLEKIWDTCTGPGKRRSMLAYVLSWIRVSGGNSILPPWVRHKFPEIGDIIRVLRYACGDDTCEYCREHNDSKKLLQHYFGFNDYRPLADGRPLQKEIIDSGLAGNSLLGILPTGGGKSICYQIPALHRYHQLGELTVVISPLKALMKDQVDNLNRATGARTAAAINGSLTLPERGAVMEKVRLGDIGILYLSPEQLRNFSIAQLLRSRDVGCWVFDEAHCLSKWGHDFRPDYLHVSEFIAGYAQALNKPALVSAFTATAKKDVIEEITNHLKEKLSINLEHHIGSIHRDNLNFEVWPVTHHEKYDVIANCLKETLEENQGGAIVYCATQRNTEDLSRFLNDRQISCEAFHAGRCEPDKRNIQDAFIEGRIPAICATNAFGMGIDKKDIRLVIHADIPGSLENYLQEAGRAGRDLEPSDCILLYEETGIENQFSMNAFSKLSIKDIRKILAILKKKGAKTPEIVITPGEIMRLMGYPDFGKDTGKARTGISWLERKGFIERSYNQTLFFNGAPAVKDMEEAGKKMARLNLSNTMKAVFTTVLHFLFNADPNTLISADEICTELWRIKDLPEKYQDSRQVITVLSDMTEAGLIKEGVIMTAFVTPKGKTSSLKNLKYFKQVETKMLSIMEDMAPDSWLTPDEADIFNLRLMSQRLKDKGFDRVNTDAVEKLLRSLADDAGEHLGKSLKISGRRGTDQLRVFVKFSWQEIRQRMELRHHTSWIILEAIISRLPEHLRTGKAEVLASFFITDIINAMGSDVFLAGFKGDARALIETCLLYLHDVKIITLQNGLGVFRQAMTLSLVPESEKRRYTRGDYEPLSHFYDQKNVQVHVMEKYARLGLEKIKTALNFVGDYFSSSYEAFISQYFPKEKKIIHTAMTAEAYKKIIQSLENPVQEAIVASEPEKNILVLAGPGSGKTKTIVHRCAWLIKAVSIDPSAILVLCFNHQAMLELRKRIRALSGQSAEFVTVMTYHGFAMRLTGRSMMDTPLKPGEPGINFDTLIDEAMDLLSGNTEPAGIDPKEAREYFLAGFRYILVDEYQDIDERQYRFISALTGRLEQDRETKIAVMAVGDDDQSIYGFRNASIKFIQQFKQDYDARTFYLMENYRSSYPVIEASNALIALNKNRMKIDAPCRINKKRKRQEHRYELMEDRVQMVHAPDTASQAVFVAGMIRRMLDQNPDLNPEDIAVVSRLGVSHPPLVALRMALAKEKIDFSHSMKNNSGFPMIRIREIQAFIRYLDSRRKESLRPLDLKQDVMDTLFQHKNTWTGRVEQILDAWCRINSDMEIRIAHAKEFALETLLEDRQEQRSGNGVFMGTVHSVKGMEFSVVFILDGGWKPRDLEEERRLFYVGMTRAKTQLFLCHIETLDNPHLFSLKGQPFVHDLAAPSSPITGFFDGLTVSILGMADLYISYPGLFPAGHEIHQHLAHAETGAKVSLTRQGGRVYILNDADKPIAALSKKGSDLWRPNLENIITARVMGIVQRQRRDEEDQTCQDSGVEAWELPILEILHERF